jgi:uncharacterized protein (TIGR04255 family)
MPFQPLNEKHAIQQVTFGLLFGKALPSATIDKLRTEGGSWCTDLPAVEATQLVEVRAEAGTGAMRPFMIRGAEFSYKRPDGSAAWSLAISGNEIIIQTSQYTRWEPTWEKVQSYLLEVLRRVVELEKPRPVTVRNVSLVYIDAFRSSDAVPNFSEVLVESPIIPRAVFDRGPLWHCHTGWFVPAEPKGRILNQVNIDTKTVSERPEITINHRQVMEFRPDLALGEVVSEEHSSDISTAFEAMHDANKREIAALLTPHMREAIRIDQ